MNFAIVDIETTGSYASGAGITEIAILISDGKQVLDRFETLVNPGRYVPYYIQSLTGIDNAMLKDAPAFADVAHRIYEMLAPCIFVAHNVQFDYSFVKHELGRVGLVLNTPRLCTVRLSRKLVPGLPSYSLGRLCNSLEIPLNNRHRAGGDADATARLFALLTSLDSGGVVKSMYAKGGKEYALPAHVPQKDFDVLPHAPGVYFFHDQSGKIIYTGKAKDIKKRVGSHFTGHNPGPQRRNFMQEIYRISYEVYATELMALIAEYAEIRARWPKYNRALKRYEPQFGLFVYEDQNDFTRLAIGKYNKRPAPLHEFMSRMEGEDILRKLCAEFDLCMKLCALPACTNACCSSDTAPIEPVVHNEKITAALAAFEAELPTFYILDKGRTEEERSCIWVERGNLWGMGYLDMADCYNSEEDMKASLKPMPGGRYIMGLINAFAAKYPYRIKFPVRASSAVEEY